VYKADFGLAPIQPGDPARSRRRAFFIAGVPGRSLERVQPGAGVPPGPLLQHGQHEEDRGCLWSTGPGDGTNLDGIAAELIFVKFGAGAVGAFGAAGVDGIGLLNTLQEMTKAYRKGQKPAEPSSPAPESPALEPVGNAPRIELPVVPPAVEPHGTPLSGVANPPAKISAAIESKSCLTNRIN
jgi:hypothetical protein